MKTFIVAYISFHDNEMIMTKTMAVNEQQALAQTLIANSWEMNEDEKKFSVKKLKRFAFDCDCMIGAMEI